MTKKELVDNLKALGFSQANGTAKNAKLGHYRAYQQADKSFLFQCINVSRAVMVQACFDLGMTLVENKGENNFIAK